MQIDLKDKVAIVTGAGRGIGRAIAETLAAEGAITVVADVRQDPLDALAEVWRDNGWQGAHLLADIREKADCARIAQDVVKRFGRIDILVNNAGVAGGGPVETLAEEVWDQNFAVNLKGMFLMCQAVMPQMKAQRAGRIVNASSFAAIIPGLGGAAYASSKAGVHALTRVLAGELGPFDITANAFAPGMIPTEMNHFADADPARCAGGAIRLTSPAGAARHAVAAPVGRRGRRRQPRVLPVLGSGRLHHRRDDRHLRGQVRDSDAVARPPRRGGRVSVQPFIPSQNPFTLPKKSCVSGLLSPPAASNSRRRSRWRALRLTGVSTASSM